MSTAECARVGTMVRAAHLTHFGIESGGFLRNQARIVSGRTIGQQDLRPSAVNCLPLSARRAAMLRGKSDPGLAGRCR